MHWSVWVYGIDKKTKEKNELLFIPKHYANLALYKYVSQHENSDIFSCIDEGQLIINKQVYNEIIVDNVLQKIHDDHFEFGEKINHKMIKKLKNIIEKKPDNVTLTFEFNI
jgi:hypothetical protein